MEAVKYHCSLNEDLIVEILLKLSVKSLLRFKSVCQHWHKIITSPYFVSNHFRRESNSTSLLVYSLWRCRCTTKKRVNECSLFRVETLERYEDVHHREHKKGSLCVPGPCNGIFCVAYLDDTLALWNPATRRMRPVPRPPFPTKDAYKLGLGMDPLTDDLKIVLIEPKHVAIYRLTDDSWRVREEKSISNSLDYHDLKIYATALSNGFCYWLGSRSSTSTHPNAIIAFDVHKELFQKIEMPECIFGSIKTVDLIWYGDNLAVSTYNIIAGKGRHDIWIFKEQGNWVKILTFSSPQTLHIGTVAGVCKRNQIVGMGTSDGKNERKLVIYDPDGGNTKTFEFPYIKCSFHYLFAFLYQESLVSL